MFSGLKCSGPSSCPAGRGEEGLETEVLSPAQRLNPGRNRQEALNVGGLESCGWRPPAGLQGDQQGAPSPAPRSLCPCLPAEAGPGRAADSLPCGVCGNLGNARSPRAVTHFPAVQGEWRLSPRGNHTGGHLLVSEAS